MARGALITFEGPEGGGKTTQIARLAERLTAAGRRVTATREPGGTPIGERLRAVLLDAAGEAPRPATEASLFVAARSELVARVIEPALDAGGIVLCDRFADATLAYQGYGHGLPLETLRAMNRLATGGRTPDLTLLLDVPVALGLGRRRAGEEWNRLDAADASFHERVREGYLALAAASPARWAKIDATRGVDRVAEAIWHAVSDLPAVGQAGASARQCADAQGEA